MLKELSTMALVATMTTTISTHFDTVLAAAHDVSMVYAQASNNINDPDRFLASVKTQEKRLNELGQRVATLNIKEELGPFGVIVAK